MMPQESDLFHVRINEQGKNYIRKFAAVSYTLLVLVVFEAGVSIYWDIRIIVMDRGVLTSWYDKAYPYIYIVLSLLSVASNIYYLRFPRSLLRSIKINDEYGANQAFGLLFRGVIIFFLSLLLSTISLIWSLTSTRLL